MTQSDPSPVDVTTPWEGHPSFPSTVIVDMLESSISEHATVRVARVERTRRCLPAQLHSYRTHTQLFSGCCMSCSVSGSRRGVSPVPRVRSKQAVYYVERILQVVGFCMWSGCLLSGGNPHQRPRNNNCKLGSLQTSQGHLVFYSLYTYRKLKAGPVGTLLHLSRAL